MTTPAIRAIAREVPCSYCGAYPGERCFGPTGTRARDPHRARIHLSHTHPSKETQ